MVIQKKKLNSLCDPANFYLVVSLFSVVTHAYHILDKSPRYTVMGSLVFRIFALIWTLVLNWVCSLKYGTKISWFLVFLPLLIVIVFMVVVFSHLVKSIPVEKSVTMPKGLRSVTLGLDKRYMLRIHLDSR